MDHFETIWIKKEETDEVPDEPDSMVQVHPSSVNIKEELEEVVNEKFVEDPLGISCSPDFIKEEPEVILEVDETESIVVTSTRSGTNNSRLIKNSESYGISFEEPNNQEVVHEELKKGTEEPAHTSTIDTHVQGLSSEGDSIFGMRLGCYLKEKEFHKFDCSYCRQSFPSKYKLVMHVFSHIDDVQPPTYVCKSCGEVFPSSVSFNKHLKMSDGDLYISAGSNEKFDFSDDNKNIILDGEVNVMEETEKQSSWEKSRKISNKSPNDKYNTHTMTYDAEKRDNAKSPHSCDFCGKSFSKLAHLKSHALKHTGFRPYNCDICGKSFTQVGSLHRHASMHTGKRPDRPHKCDVCGKYFVQLIHLKNHVLIHTGERPHKCDICGKCFTQVVALKRHALIHTGLRPHKCDICGKSFTLSGDLKRHALIHTGKSINKCDFCGKSFSRLDYLKKHALQHT